MWNGKRSAGILLVSLIASLFLAGCNGQAGDYTAASSISKDGFAKNSQGDAS